MRNHFLVGALIAALSPPVLGDELNLPDFGRSANAGVSEREEYYYGLSVLRQMRNAGILIEDPILDEYLRTLQTRLGEASSSPDENFRYCLIADKEFNAFAVPGGVIGINTGLMLNAGRESELAAVLAHEVAHVTQKHMVRAMERTQKASLPVMLGTLVAAAAAAKSQNRSGSTIRDPNYVDPTTAVLVSGSALMQQLQINYTRDNEFEADRVGIQTLKKAGFDVTAMASMFGRMQTAFRTGAGADVPQYLRTHPITTTRIAEAKTRAQSLQEKFVQDDNTKFLLMRERARVMQSSEWTQLVRFYRDALKERGDSNALHYGLSLSLAKLGKHQEAQVAAENVRLTGELRLLKKLLMLELAVEAKQEKTWRADFQALHKIYPKHRVISSMYAQALIDLGSKRGGEEARDILRDTVTFFDDDPVLYEQLSRAYQLSGDKIRAGEAFARATAYRGGLEDALAQLESMTRDLDMDYYQRARVDAQIAELTPIVLEIRKRDGVGSTRQRLSIEALRMRSHDHAH
jgi:beta-barrel assembly-enhancing protease